MAKKPLNLHNATESALAGIRRELGASAMAINSKKFDKAKDHLKVAFKELGRFINSDYPKLVIHHQEKAAEIAARKTTTKKRTRKSKAA
jgi:hypothetical protein